MEASKVADFFIKAKEILETKPISDEMKKSIRDKINLLKGDKIIMK